MLLGAEMNYILKICRRDEETICCYFELPFGVSDPIISFLSHLDI